jgi:hypothetical protein
MSGAPPIADAQRELKPAAAERDRLEGLWPDAFRDGVRAGYGLFPAVHLPGGYPHGFHAWPLEKRNAYFAGFNVGFTDRRRRRDRARDG